MIYHDISCQSGDIWFTIYRDSFSHMVLYVTVTTMRYIRVNHIEWILLLLFHQLSYSWHKGLFGGHSLEKCRGLHIPFPILEAQDATSEGAFQGCRLFHLIRRSVGTADTVGQRGTYEEPTTWCCSLASTKQVPQLCQVTCWRSSIPGTGTPHIRADKIHKISFWGALVHQKNGVKVILMFEHPFNDPMVWLRASRIRLRFEMVGVLKGFHSRKTCVGPWVVFQSPTRFGNFRTASLHKFILSGCTSTFIYLIKTVTLAV